MLFRSKKRGLDTLLKAVEDQLESASPMEAPLVSYPPAVESDLSELIPVIERWRPGAPAQRTRAVALWCLLSLGEDSLRGVPDSVRSAVQKLRSKATAEGRNPDLEIIATRYRWIDRQVNRASLKPAPKPTTTERIDGVLTHPVFGLLAFAMVMLFRSEEHTSELQSH